MRGYAAIGIENGKFPVNIGTLWRTANVLGAAFVFTVGNRYQAQPSDTMRTPRHVPLWHFDDPEDLRKHIPMGASIVGVEMVPQARTLKSFVHPGRAVYILGAEDRGLSKEMMDRTDHVISLPGEISMNVSVAGSIVLYDRWSKTTKAAA